VPGWTFRTATFDIVSTSTTAGFVTKDVACPAGTRAIGGGVTTTTPADLTVKRSAPAGQATGWTAAVLNRAFATRAATVWAICAEL
jgi:hypothetical protein